MNKKLLIIAVLLLIALPITYAQTACSVLSVEKFAEQISDEKISGLTKEQIQNLNEEERRKLKGIRNGIIAVLLEDFPEINGWETIPDPESPKFPDERYLIGLKDVLRIILAQEVDLWVLEKLGKKIAETEKKYKTSTPSTEIKNFIKSYTTIYKDTKTNTRDKERYKKIIQKLNIIIKGYKKEQPKFYLKKGGQTFEISDEYYVGRVPDKITEEPKLVFDDPKISSTHAKVYVNEYGQFGIIDLNSRNGVFVKRKKSVNWEKIPANRKVRINAGDEITIGDTILQILDYEKELKELKKQISELISQQNFEQAKNLVNEELNKKILPPALLAEMHSDINEREKALTAQPVGIPFNVRQALQNLNKQKQSLILTIINLIEQNKLGEAKEQLESSITKKALTKDNTDEKTAINFLQEEINKRTPALPEEELKPTKPRIIEQNGEIERRVEALEEQVEEVIPELASEEVYKGILALISEEGLENNLLDLLIEENKRQLSQKQIDKLKEFNAKEQSPVNILISAPETTLKDQLKIFDDLISEAKKLIKNPEKATGKLAKARGALNKIVSEKLLSPEEVAEKYAPKISRLSSLITEEELKPTKPRIIEQNLEEFNGKSLSGLFLELVEERGNEAGLPIEEIEFYFDESGKLIEVGKLGSLRTKKDNEFRIIIGINTINQKIVRADYFTERLTKEQREIIEKYLEELLKEYYQSEIENYDIKIGKLNEEIKELEKIEKPGIFAGKAQKEEYARAQILLKNNRYLMNENEHIKGIFENQQKKSERLTLSLGRITEEESDYRKIISEIKFVYEQEGVVAARQKLENYKTRLDALGRYEEALEFLNQKDELQRETERIKNYEDVKENSEITENIFDDVRAFKLEGVSQERQAQHAIRKENFINEVKLLFIPASLRSRSINPQIIRIGLDYYNIPEDSYKVKDGTGKELNLNDVNKEMTEFYTENNYENLRRIINQENFDEWRHLYEDSGLTYARVKLQDLLRLEFLKAKGYTQELSPYIDFRTKQQKSVDAYAASVEDALLMFKKYLNEHSHLGRRAFQKGTIENPTNIIQENFKITDVNPEDVKIIETFNIGERSYAIVDYDGKKLLFYRSGTHAYWKRLEFAYAALSQGKISISWYFKPASETANNVNERMNEFLSKQEFKKQTDFSENQINTMIDEKILVDRITSKIFVKEQGVITASEDLMPSFYRYGRSRAQVQVREIQKINWDNIPITEETKTKCEPTSSASCVLDLSKYGSAESLVQNPKLKQALEQIIDYYSKEHKYEREQGYNNWIRELRVEGGQVLAVINVKDEYTSQVQKDLQEAINLGTLDQYLTPEITEEDINAVMREYEALSDNNLANRKPEIKTLTGKTKLDALTNYRTRTVSFALEHGNFKTTTQLTRVLLASLSYGINIDETFTEQTIKVLQNTHPTVEELRTLQQILNYLIRKETRPEQKIELISLRNKAQEITPITEEEQTITPEEFVLQIGLEEALQLEEVTLEHPEFKKIFYQDTEYEELLTGTRSIQEIIKSREQLDLPWAQLKTLIENTLAGRGNKLTITSTDRQGITVQREITPQDLTNEESLKELAEGKRLRINGETFDEYVKAVREKPSKNEADKINTEGKTSFSTEEIRRRLELRKRFYELQNKLNILRQLANYIDNHSPHRLLFDINENEYLEIEKQFRELKEELTSQAIQFLSLQPFERKLLNLGDVQVQAILFNEFKDRIKQAYKEFFAKKDFTKKVLEREKQITNRIEEATTKGYYEVAEQVTREEPVFLTSGKVRMGIPLMKRTALEEIIVKHAVETTVFIQEQQETLNRIGTLRELIGIPQKTECEGVASAYCYARTKKPLTQEQKQKLTENTEKLMNRLIQEGKITRQDKENTEWVRSVNTHGTLLKIIINVNKEKAKIVQEELEKLLEEDEELQPSTLPSEVKVLEQIINEAIDEVKKLFEKNGIPFDEERTRDLVHKMASRVGQMEYHGVQHIMHNAKTLIEILTKQYTALEQKIGKEKTDKVINIAWYAMIKHDDGYNKQEGAPGHEDRSKTLAKQDLTLLTQEELGWVMLMIDATKFAASPNTLNDLQKTIENYLQNPTTTEQLKTELTKTIKDTPFENTFIKNLQDVQSLYAVIISAKASATVDVLAHSDYLSLLVGLWEEFIRENNPAATPTIADQISATQGFFYFLENKIPNVPISNRLTLLGQMTYLSDATKERITKHKAFVNEFKKLWDSIVKVETVEGSKLYSLLKTQLSEEDKTKIKELQKMLAGIGYSITQINIEEIILNSIHLLKQTGAQAKPVQVSDVREKLKIVFEISSEQPDNYKIDDREIAYTEKEKTINTQLTESRTHLEKIPLELINQIPSSIDEEETIDDTTFAKLLRPLGIKGGDYFYTKKLPSGKIRIFLLDAQDHGALGASNLAVLLTKLSEVEQTESLETYLEKSSEKIRELKGKGGFMTPYTAIDYNPETQEIEYLTSGHKIFLASEEGTETLGVPSPLLSSSGERKTQTKKLSQGSTVLVSDGVLESLGRGDQNRGAEILEELIETNKRKTPSEIKQAIMSEVQKILPKLKKEQQDDISIIVFKVGEEKLPEEELQPSPAPKTVPLEEILGETTLDQLAGETPYEGDKTTIKGTVFERISSGRYGKVYKATTQEGNVYALKIFRTDRQKGEPSVEDEAIREYIVGTQGLEGLLKVKFVVTEKERPVALVEEFIEGKPVSDYTRFIDVFDYSSFIEGTKFPNFYNAVPDNSAENLEKAMENLASAKISISHNDLEIGTNILLQKDGEIKIIDFGLAKIHQTKDSDFFKRHLEDWNSVYRHMTALSVMKESLKTAKGVLLNELIIKELQNIERFKQRAVKRAEQLTDKSFDLTSHFEDIDKIVFEWKRNLERLAKEKHGLSQEQFNKLIIEAERELTPPKEINTKEFKEFLQAKLSSSLQQLKEEFNFDFVGISTTQQDNIYKIRIYGEDEEGVATVLFEAVRSVQNDEVTGEQFLLFDDTRVVSDYQGYNIDDLFMQAEKEHYQEQNIDTEIRAQINNLRNAHLLFKHYNPEFSTRTDNTFIKMDVETTSEDEQLLNTIKQLVSETLTPEQQKTDQELQQKYFTGQSMKAFGRTIEKISIKIYPEDNCSVCSWKDVSKNTGLSKEFIKKALPFLQKSLRTISDNTKITLTYENDEIKTSDDVPENKHEEVEKLVEELLDNRSKLESYLSRLLNEADEQRKKLNAQHRNVIDTNALFKFWYWLTNEEQKILDEREKIIEEIAELEELLVSLEKVTEEALPEITLEDQLERFNELVTQAEELIKESEQLIGE